MREQTVAFQEILVAETDPRGSVRAIAEQHGATFVPVAAEAFDHAGTRSMLAARARGERLVFLSQDVGPQDPDAIATLLAGLDEHRGVVAAFGRQVSGPSESEFSQLKRLFNYPRRSTVSRWEDRGQRGYRAAFVSNTFAAYERRALESVGWFGSRLLMCEDVAAGAALLGRGWKIAYVPEAVVVHDHRASRTEERRRYFDIGVSHEQLADVLRDFGQVDREGLRFLRFALGLLLRGGGTRRVPAFVVWSFGNRLAYALGRRHRALPASWKRRLTGSPGWWTGGEGTFARVDPPLASVPPSPPLSDPSSSVTLSGSK